jgi:Ig-like domain CHU_C associated/Secretion system C-terminal sorting domain
MMLTDTPAAFGGRLARGFALLLIIVSGLISPALYAQPYIFAYGFSTDSAPYTALSQAQAVTINGGGGTVDDGFSAPLTLPFTFRFGQGAFSTITLSSNGYVGLGTHTTPANYQLWSGVENQVIAFCNTNLTSSGGGGTSYKVATVGQAPNRIYKIEAAGFQKVGSATKTGNAQVWLYESTYVIELHYGAFGTGWSQPANPTIPDTVRVGLRGAPAWDLAAVSGSWAAPFSSSDPSGKLMLNSAQQVLPAPGTVFRFTPPEDFDGPVLDQVRLTPAGGACTPVAHTVTVEADDFTGIASVELQYTVGTAAPVTLPMTYQAAQEVWSATIPAQGSQQVSVVIQAVDSSPNQNGNISGTYTYADGPTTISAGADQNLTVGATATLQATVGAEGALKITEFTLFNDGTGAMNPYPAYTGSDDDFVEITNIGPVPRSLSGYSMVLIYPNIGKGRASGLTGPQTARQRAGGSFATIRRYDFPSTATIPANSTLVLHWGDGIDSPTNRYYHEGNAEDLSSGDDVGFLLIGPGEKYLDAVAVNGFSFEDTYGLYGVGWSGVGVSSTGGAAGARLTGTDTNSATGWAESTVNSLQTIGAVNPGLTPLAPPVITWTGGVLTAATNGNPITTPAHPFPAVHTYTATTTYNGCTVSDQVLVTVTGSCTIPAPTMSSNGPVCAGQTLTLSAAGVAQGATYAWSGPNGFTSTDPSPQIPAATVAAAGTYSLTITRNGCTGTSTLAVVVNALPTALGPNGLSQCGPGAVTLAYNQLPTGISTVRWYATATSAQPVFTGATFNTPALTATTTYYAAAVSTAGCESATRTPVMVTIVTPATADFTYPTAAGCGGSAGALTPALATGATAGVFSATPAGLSLNAQTGAIDLATSQPGSYTIVNTLAASAPCPAITATATVDIYAAPAATLTAVGPVSFCVGDSVVLRAAPRGVDVGGFGVTGTGYSYAYQLNNAVIVGETADSLIVKQSGSYTVTVTDGNTCVATSAAVIVTVSPLASAAFSYPTNTLCLSAPNPTPAISGTPGGTFSAAPIGLVIDPVTGELDLTASQPGQYTVTYAINGPCPATADQALTLTAAPLAGFQYLSKGSFCAGSTNTLDPSFDTDATAGVFSADSAGLTLDPATGAVNLATSQPGTYIVTNTIAATGSCLGVAATATLTIEAAPNPMIAASGAVDICEGQTVTLTASGGDQYVWSTGETATSIDVTTAGTYSVMAMTTAGCSATSAEVIVTVTPVPTAAFAYDTTSYCLSGSAPVVTLGGTSGGTFSSTPAGLDLDPVTGSIDLTNSQAGTYEVTYTVGTTCTAFAAQTITLTPVPLATFAYGSGPNVAYCLNSGATPTPTITGTPGGTFSVAPAGLMLDASTGALDLAASQPGTYVVTYVVGSGTCRDSLGQTILVSPAPQGAFAYSAAIVCAGTTAVLQPNIAPGSALGAFSAQPAGLVLDAQTGVIDLSVSQPGNYVVTNVVAGATGCRPDSATFALAVVALPTVAITGLNLSYCTADAAVALTGSVNGVGGVGFFTIDGQPALTFDPAALGVGPHSVALTSTTGSGCEATISLIVNVVPTPLTPVISAAPQGSGVVVLTSSQPVGNQWFLNGQPIPGATGATYTVSTSAQNGAYTVQCTVAGCPSALSAPQNVTVTGTSAALAAQPDVALYPNPTFDGQVTLELPAHTAPTIVMIFDAVGREVLRTTWHPAATGATRGAQVLDLRQLPAGVYLLRFTTEAGTMVRQLVRE